MFSAARKRLQRLARSHRLLLFLAAAVTILHLARGDLYPGKSLELHRPGRLGRSLVARHENLTQISGSPSWHLAFRRYRPEADLFGSPEIDDSCDGLELPLGFTKGNEQKSKGCWRLRLLYQLDAWRPHKSFATWKDQEEKNTAAIDRLRRCLLQPLSDNSQGPDACSIKATKVVVGHWWFWTMGFTKAGLSGEAIWTASMIDALEEQGYTVLSTSEYEGMIQAHAGIPDLISHFFVDEKIMLTCMADPFCIARNDFEPTSSWFPDLLVDADGRPIRTVGMEGNREGDRQKWVWSQDELNDLDLAAQQGIGRSRGTIPLYKLFVLTWWGTKTGEGYWPVPEGFSWNPLGSEWTISPFSYPDHTFMPYSIERECSAVPLTPPERKINRAFILAKLAEYFYDKRKAPPQSVWPEFEKTTGLEPVSVATDRLDGDRGWLNFTVPDGVTPMKPLSRDQFELEVGKSKVMVGIGRPYISPSVYTSLCQGTPVVLPTYADPEEIHRGYQLFNGEYAQHGPASLIGPPYVYTYRHGDDPQEFLELVSRAASQPIDRYIPEDMTWSAVRHDVDDLMLFNWAEHAQRIRASQSIIKPDRLDVLGRCFEIGRCKPLSGAP